MIWGYTYFWKHPYIYILNYLLQSSFPLRFTLPWGGFPCADGTPRSAVLVPWPGEVKMGMFLLVSPLIFFLLKKTPPNYMFSSTHEKPSPHTIHVWHSSWDVRHQCWQFQKEIQAMIKGEIILSKHWAFLFLVNIVNLKFVLLLMVYGKILNTVYAIIICIYNHIISIFQKNQLNQTPILNHTNFT